MTWDGFDMTAWAALQFMFLTLPLQKAAIPSEMPQELFPLQSTTTISRIAVSGTPLSPSSRRSSRMRLIASARLRLASSDVRP